MLASDQQCVKQKGGMFVRMQLHNFGFAVLPDPNANCTTGDVRLRGGARGNEGRVEICYDNHWGALCDNDWDNNDAAVVCRQLGLSTEGECLKRMKREDECVGVFWKRKGNRKDMRKEK